MEALLYTTNPTTRLAAAAERSMSISDLESSVESHRAVIEQCPSKSVERSVSVRWNSTGDSKSLLLVERLVAAVERLLGLVVQQSSTLSSAIFKN